jgi:hypothetical protein
MGWVVIINVCIFWGFAVQKFLDAARKGNDYEVRRMLENDKVDVNARHALGWTALHVAAMNGHSSTVKLLVENGADITLGDEFTTAFIMAKKTRIHSLEGGMDFLDGVRDIFGRESF